MKIIAATQNKGKLKEIYAILRNYDFELVNMAEAGLNDIDVEETGTTCEENSYIKAKAILDILKIPVIADDTGLFVDVLNGEPGVNSARYSGIHGDDAANRKKLLEKLKGLPFEKRTAKFVTVITLLYPDGKKIVARGECKGHISLEEKGDGGFGYDSIFIPLESDMTFSQLGADFKNTISHRARALKRLEELL